MTNFDIARQRLHNQHLAHQTLKNPQDIVRWLGAVQAQDYGGAKWALAQRLLNPTDNAIEQTFTAGAILRTHVMRPTWHFVAPEDIRWLLALTAPRVHAFNAHYYRKSELDSALFMRSAHVMAKALEGGKQLTRAELAALLGQSGIVADGIRLGLIMMHAELDGLICSGARRGKQFTYALLDERAPDAKTLERDEALAELTKRYFTSHGPAMVKDFAWWSGLTVADVKAGLDMVKSELVHEVVDGLDYWRSASMPDAPPAKDKAPTAYLLPNYDEYGIAYKNHSAVFDMANVDKLDPSDPLGRFIFNHTVAINGEIVGSWKRTLSKREVVVDANTFAPMNEAEHHALEAAVERYGLFLGLPAALRIIPS